LLLLIISNVRNNNFIHNLLYYQDQVFAILEVAYKTKQFLLSFESQHSHYKVLFILIPCLINYIASYVFIIIIFIVTRCKQRIEHKWTQFSLTSGQHRWPLQHIHTIIWPRPVMSRDFGHARNYFTHHLAYITINLTVQSKYNKILLFILLLYYYIFITILNFACILYVYNSLSRLLSCIYNNIAKNINTPVWGYNIVHASVTFLIYNYYVFIIKYKHNNILTHFSY
jgi:hypothetical protein